jgi:DHA2 family methylenomycin A resistance protein-like MFS transporter
VGNLASARLMPRWGTALPLRRGLALAAAASAVLPVAALLLDLPPLAVDGLFALANLGAGLAIPAMTSTMMTLGQGPHASTAAAALNANRQIGALLGVAAVGLVLHSVDRWAVSLPLACALLAAAYAAAAVLAWRE